MMASRNCKLQGSSSYLSALAVVVSVESEDAAEQTMMQRDVKSFASIKSLCGVQGIIVGLCINCSQERWFIGSNADHLTLPYSALIRGRGNLDLDLSQERIVVPLKDLVVSGLPTKIEYELQCSNEGNGCSIPSRINAQCGEKIADSGGPQEHDEEVKSPVPTLKRATAGRVVEGIAEHVEANVLAVLDHYQGFPFGGLIGVDGVGCLGPTVEPGCAGWRGPIEWIEMVGPGGVISTPSTIFSFSDIECVSFWVGLKGMTGTGGRFNASRCRHNSANSSIGPEREAA